MSGFTVSQGTKELGSKVPVRFVHNDRFGAREAIASEDFEALLLQRPDIMSSFAENGDLCWTVQTWCRLRDAGFGGIEIATEPAEGRINIAKAKTLSRSGPGKGLFQVSIQADYPRVLWAQFHIQQNADLLCDDAALQYLWPQAGIIPRDPTREGVKRIGFLGNVEGNLAASEDEWRELMAQRGLEFVARPPELWHDFSDIDIAIGLRSFGNSRHSRKPANKMINAWFAGVPFIGGADSAFAQVGTAGIDHLLATNRQELLMQVERLRSDAFLYQSIASAGHQKAEAFAPDRLVEQWVSLLEGSISARYKQWAAHPRRERNRTLAYGAAQSAVEAAKAVGRKLLGRGYEE
ncbi:hypothetical protein K3165_08815 [Qipengyuania sp. 1XM1-15A]|uniref:glycosyltransferase n=1 Tax=Qipengyuania xiamenensis TaxID=2867237 RepID=UPI001C8774CC|nr:hypothetical protein [Qipengyuania xiamenensis]MBX7533020.1 hypothetical protein [Qipengyuania xiamenensis]